MVCVPAGAATHTMLNSSLDDFTRQRVLLKDVERTVYVAGVGPAVIVLHEMPGIGPHLLRFATFSGISTRSSHTAFFSARNPYTPVATFYARVGSFLPNSRGGGAGSTCTAPPARASQLPALAVNPRNPADR